MRLNGLDIYMEGLAVYLAYHFRSPFCVWSNLSEEEIFHWKQEAKDLINDLKKQKDTKG